MRLSVCVSYDVEYLGPRDSRSYHCLISPRLPPNPLLSAGSPSVHPRRRARSSYSCQAPGHARRGLPFSLPPAALRSAPPPSSGLLRGSQPGEDEVEENTTHGVPARPLNRLPPPQPRLAAFLLPPTSLSLAGFRLAPKKQGACDAFPAPMLRRVATRGATLGTRRTAAEDHRG
ncbi:hypothetical protein ZWY2020_044845 [Hordeum vulgare]|nr:hypothetical protein ZWY2020_044845 [Hordeum vulgare]